jgi:hypothetical protein
MLTKQTALIDGREWLLEPRPVTARWAARLAAAGCRAELWSVRTLATDDDRPTRYGWAAPAKTTGELRLLSVAG